MKKFANIFIVIASVLIFTGILFRNMHWPGASISLIVGINLSLLGVLFYFIARYRDKSSVKIATYSVYFYFFVMVVGTGYYSAIGATKDLLNEFHFTNVQIEKSNDILLNAIGTMSSPKVMELYNEINHHKLALISGLFHNYGDVTKKEVMMSYCDSRGIPLYKDNQDLAGQYFTPGGQASEVGIRLENSLKDLRVKYIVSLGEDHPVLFDPIQDYVNWDGSIIPWINNLSEHLPMISVLSKLSLIQNQILHCELAIQNKF